MFVVITFAVTGRSYLNTLLEQRALLITASAITPDDISKNFYRLWLTWNWEDSVITLELGLREANQYLLGVHIYDTQIDVTA